MTPTSADLNELHVSLLRVERAASDLVSSIWLCLVTGSALVAYALLRIMAA